MVAGDDLSSVEAIRVMKGEILFPLLKLKLHKPNISHNSHMSHTSLLFILHQLTT
jgi:hypothetical protein